MTTSTPAQGLRSIHSIHAERQALSARREALRKEEQELSYRIAEIDAAKDAFAPSYEAKQRLDCERLFAQYRECAGEQAARSLITLHGNGSISPETCPARHIPDVIWALIHCLTAEGKVPNV